MLRAPTGVESVWITAFILFLIMPPVSSWSDAGLVALAAVIAMASKYVLAIKKRHIFNPAAIGALLAGLVMGSGAIWWIGSVVMLPFVLVVGLLLVRKIRRMELFVVGAVAGVLSAFVTSTASLGFTNGNHSHLLFQIVASWPIVFFASIMLTEPATTPPTKRLQIIYGILVGLLFGSPLHLGILYMSPELALLIGNVFSYAVSSKQRIILHLKQKTQIAKDTFQFLFTVSEPLAFQPGQYLEWTLPHAHPDLRGNRRYFTIASAPSEEGLAIGVKIQDQSSSFKKALRSLEPGALMSASSLSGDFTLLKDTHTKLVFIAGGIGITPFRSMIQSFLDIEEKRDVVLFYASMSQQDFAYQELFAEAQKKINLKVVYIVTSPAENWNGYTGYLTADILKKECPDFADRVFYLSGPNAMVQSYRTLIKSLNVPSKKIKTDYFPGF